MTQAIDAWTHIFPPAYFRKLQTITAASGPLKRWMNLQPLYDLDTRFRVMDRFDGYRQLLTLSIPPAEGLAMLRRPPRVAAWIISAIARYCSPATSRSMPKVAPTW